MNTRGGTSALKGFCLNFDREKSVGFLVSFSLSLVFYLNVQHDSPLKQIENESYHRRGRGATECSVCGMPRARKREARMCVRVISRARGREKRALLALVLTATVPPLVLCRCLLSSGRPIIE